MAFELPTDRNVAPQFTTVAGFSIGRLADPVLRVQYAETAPGWNLFTVAFKGDNHTLHVGNVVATPSSAIGLVLYQLDGTLVGTIETYVVDSDPTLATVTLTGPGLSGAAPIVLRTPRLNAFGIQMQEASNGSRQWELAMSSDHASHAARMNTLLGTITVTVIAAALAKLGITRTPAEIAAAVHEMALDGNNLDSIIASTFEQLERDRRSGALTTAEFIPLGTVPNA